MVDRVAAMLNYFLCHLVGPKKKNFKVSNYCNIFILLMFKGDLDFSIFLTRITEQF